MRGGENVGFRNLVSNFLYRQAEKRGWLDDFKGNIRYGGRYVSNSEDALSSSDVYSLLQDISNQIVLAKWKVVNLAGVEQPNHNINRVLNRPNNYLTRSEFLKLLTNVFLLDGEVFPIFDGRELHIANNIYTELDEQLIVHFKTNGTEIPASMIRHIKNIGTDHLSGVGISKLGRDTLEGVLNAEKVLTDKYRKGGLLAFILKLDAHISPQNAAQSKLINAILDQLESIDESRTVKLIPLGKGYSIDTMKAPIDDDKILSYLNVYKKDLGKFMGVDVEIYRELMKTDIEKAMMYLHNKAVRPILKLFGEHLSALFFDANSQLRIEAEINILDFVPYSTKTNIAFNLVRTMITTPDDSREMLGFDKLNSPEASKLYISKDLVAGEDLGKATDDSLKGGDENGKEKGNTDI